MLIVKHAKAKATRKVRIHRCRRTTESKFSHRHASMSLRTCLAAQKKASFPLACFDVTSHLSPYSDTRRWICTARKLPEAARPHSKLSALLLWCGRWLRCGCLQRAESGLSRLSLALSYSLILIPSLSLSAVPRDTARPCHLHQRSARQAQANASTSEQPQPLPAGTRWSRRSGPRRRGPGGPGPVWRL